MEHQGTIQSAEAQAALLNEVVKRCAARAALGPVVVVFDLDGTLLDNRPRTLAILREVAENWAEAHPSAVKALAALQPDALGYLVTDALHQAGVAEHLFEEALEVWRQRFFTDSTLAHDIPLAGAVAFAQACYAAGGNLVYLTGRDLPNMALGSFASLRDRGFPVGVVGTELVLKPEFRVPDHQFKRDVAPSLARLGEVIATFDNEPGNCNIFAEQFPEALHFHLATQFAPNPPALQPSVFSLRDFRVDAGPFAAK